MAVVAPAHTMRALAARRHLEMAFDAVKRDNKRKRNVVTNSGSTEAALGAEELRARVRHEEQNSEMVSGVLDILVDRVIGTGISVEPMVRTTSGELATSVNTALRRLRRELDASPEVTKELTTPGVQRIVCRTLFRDGECFAQQLVGRVPSYKYSTSVPYALELFEPDMVPMGLEDSEKKIRYGIKRNDWGQALQYFVHKTDPAESYGGRHGEYRTIPAAQMLHVKHVTRIGQARGYSPFGCVLNRFSDVRDFEESERIAARIAAAQVLAITRDNPAAGITLSEFSGGGTTDTEKSRAFPVTPGAVWEDLQPGEKVEILSSDRPNNNIDAFRSSQYRSSALGIGVSYSSLSKHYDGSYSSQRQELVESDIHYVVLRQNFIDTWCKPDHYQFVRAVALTGELDLADVDMGTLYDADFRGAPMPWIDPEKEIDAELKWVESDMKAKGQVMRERRMVPADVWDEIKRERALEPEPRGKILERPAKRG